MGIINIHSTIQNYEDEDERVIRKAYDSQMNLQNTTFLTSQGVYRLLYNSKKEEAKKFRKWAGNILDDIIFNESRDLQLQLKEKQLELEEKTYEEIEKTGCIYVIKMDGGVKVGKTKDTVSKRLKGLQTGNVNNIEILFIRF